MKLFCRTGKYQIPPWYYGYVRREDFGQLILWCVVPFHLLARLGYALQFAWFLFRYYGWEVDAIAEQHWVSKIRKKAYEDGYADGRTQWYRDQFPERVIEESWWP